MSYALYCASVLGALSLLLMMPRAGYTPLRIGALLGASTLGGLWLWLSRSLPDDLGMARAAFSYYYVFSAIAIAGSARVITHTRPVYAALWFVLVVLASAGLLLSLSAEFIAMAMVIIYGGAILVTYVFVIMLAARSGRDADDASAMDGGEPYDRVAREPLAAVIVGFVLIAALGQAAFSEPEVNPVARGLSDQQIIAGVPGDPDQPAILGRRADARLLERIEDPQQRKLAEQSFSAPGHLDNVERIGLDLFRGHPLGLELAGVILLVSLIGAVVIARLPETEAAEDKLSGDAEASGS